MIRHDTDNGSVNVSTSVYTDIVGTAATNCFGVKGMAARSVKDGVYHLLRKESVGKGVHVEFHEDGTISIDLHIVVDYGVNLNAVGESIKDACAAHGADADALVEKLNAHFAQKA